MANLDRVPWKEYFFPPTFVAPIPYLLENCVFNKEK